MKVIADENIPYVKDAFLHMGDVHTMPAAEITAEIVNDADVLLVRSVTKVNESLLAGSSVKFAATATIGMDHIDREYLDKSGIGFSSAPGSNATSVSEWVTAAMLLLAVERGFALRGKTLGIVGVGNVGSRVEKKARALGMNVILNDPPRAEKEGQGAFSSLEDLLMASDIVTVHVPLEKDGEYPTFHLAGGAFFEKMKPGAVFFNSSRGKVVDEKALLLALDSGKVSAAALDVWEVEPGLSHDTLKKVFLGTQHIAGYSFDGKVAGTQMIHAAACRHFGIEDTWDPQPLLPAPDVPEYELPDSGSETEVLHGLVSTVYSIAGDYGNLKKVLGMDAEESAKEFTRLRKTYPRRREFMHTVVDCANVDDVVRSAVAGLGFAVK